MWPSHLAEDVRFDHAAAAAVVVALERLARSIEDHATTRAQDLAGAAHFRGRTRRTVDELTSLQERRAAALVQRLHAEARALEADADAAHRAAADLADARARWRARRGRASLHERQEQHERATW